MPKKRKSAKSMCDNAGLDVRFAAPGAKPMPLVPLTLMCGHDGVTKRKVQASLVALARSCGNDAPYGAPGDIDDLVVAGDPHGVRFSIERAGKGKNNSNNASELGIDPCVAPANKHARAFFANFRMLDITRGKGIVDAEYVRALPDPVGFSRALFKALDIRGAIDIDADGEVVMLPDSGGYGAAKISDLAGLSSLMPVAAEAWRASKQPEPGIVWIESPEAHLHPQWQSGLLAFINECARGWRGTRFVLDTSSETIANVAFHAVDVDLSDRNSRNIENPAFKSDDAALIMFGGDKERGKPPKGYDMELHEFRFSDGGLKGDRQWFWGFFLGS